MLAVNAADDTVIVYYAGHGLLTSHGVLHLAVADTDPEHVTYTAVPVEWLRMALAESPAKNRILILDCCFSGHATTAMSSVSSAVTAAIEINGTYTLASAPAYSTSVAPAGNRFTALHSRTAQGSPRWHPRRG
ncbi:caspase family protein [Micromonospora sp. MH33]|uniref:caspase family protein n=1 Tax=Micromonospora sp. MH33 TaxID=1945509 RepID=UPI000D148870|nr:caspase family protein [Micromonospora sp. MH33]